MSNMARDVWEWIAKDVWEWIVDWKWLFIYILVMFAWVLYLVHLNNVIHECETVCDITALNCGTVSKTTVEHIGCKQDQMICLNKCNR